MEDGLSNDLVTCMVQDSMGYVWVGTENGLSRYDGHSFTVFNESNSELCCNSITCLMYDDRENRLWIGTNENLVILDCSTLKLQCLESGQDYVLHNISDIVKGHDGNIIIANHYNGIVKYYADEGIFKPFPVKTDKRESHKYVRCVMDDGRGRIFIGHDRGGMTVLDIRTGVARNYRHVNGDDRSLPGNNVYDIYTDSRGNIWVGTNRGLALFSPEKNNFTVFCHDDYRSGSLLSDHVYCLAEMESGKLWIGTDIGGLSLLDIESASLAVPDSVSFENHTYDNTRDAISSRNIRSLMKDSFGNIWIGNYGAGIDFMSHSSNKFAVLPYTWLKKNAVIERPVWSIKADSRGNMWIGSENEVAIFNSGKLEESIDLTPVLNRSFVRVMGFYEDNQGNMLCGLFDDGLVKIENGTRKLSRIDIGMEYVDVISFCSVRDGYVLVGTEYGLLEYSEKTGKVRKVDEVNRILKEKSIYSMVLDNKGRLWMGTYGGGIVVLDKDLNLKFYLDTQSGLPSNTIRQLYFDLAGWIWAVTTRGIAYIKDIEKPHDVMVLDSDAGLMDNNIKSVIGDSNGFIWVSYDCGISRLDVSMPDSVMVANYDFNDGVPKNLFVECGADCGPGGLLYFASLGGAVVVDPYKVESQHKSSDVNITECEFLDENRETRFLGMHDGGEYEFEYDCNSFRISFAVSDFSQSRQVEYAYMVEGLDERWIDVHGTNSIILQDLSPGKYILHIRARLKNQINYGTDTEAMVTIAVKQPLWSSLYAWIVYLLVLIGLSFSFIRYYRIRLERKNEERLKKVTAEKEKRLNDERLKFYTNVTHELRTPLTLIIGPLEDLENDDSLSHESKLKVKTIHASAHKLLNMIGRLLEFRKTETNNRKLSVVYGTLGNLIAEAALGFKDMCSNRGVELKIDVDDSGDKIYYDPDIISTVMDNLLSNAVKYTEHGQICVSMQIIHDNGVRYAEISVADTGYGIDEQSLPHIFERYFQANGRHQASGTGIGLALVKSLIELHHGQVYVESKLGAGSVFTFRIPADEIYADAVHLDDAMPVGEEKSAGVEDQSKRVMLIVEDNDDIRHYVAEAFAEEFDVVEAFDGKYALDYALKHIPDIIISDIMMPVMDGLDMCRKIKADIRTCHIPVILLTAKDSMQDREFGYDCGADSYITKPFSIKLLRTRICNIFKMRASLAAEYSGNKNEGNTNPVSASEIPIASMNRLDEEFMKKLTEVVQDNIENGKLDVNYLAKEMNMSYSTFYRKMKGLIGVSANVFIRKMRLKNSYRLLSEGNCNVSEAAYMSGFNDITYFRECFYREYGVNPSAVMKKGNK